MVERQEEEPIPIDLSRLMAALKRRARLWMLTGLVSIVLMAAYQLWVKPDYYAASVSVSMQQSSSPISNSPFAALLGAGGTGRKYQGLLRSRQLATAVERKARLKELYGIPTDTKLVEVLNRSVTTDEKSEDGLVVLKVTLPGPPLLASNADARRAQVRETAALTANAYVSALRNYFATSDNETGNVLVRDAVKQLNKIKAEHERARLALRDFIQNLRNRDTRAAPAAGGLAAASTAQDLIKLYDSLSAVKTDIQAAEAAQATRNKMLAAQLNDLGQLPAEDPLLTDARDRVSRENATLQNLLISYSPENPRVRAARERLRQAKAQLQKQVEGFRKRLTSEQVQATATMERLRATRENLLNQIADAERRLRIRRELAGELDRLQREFDVTLEKRKAAEVETTRLQLSTVSGLSRITVVDPALPPEKSEFNPFRFVLYCLLAAVLGILFVTGLEGFGRLVLPKRVAEPAPASGTTATGGAAKRAQKAEP